MRIACLGDSNTYGYDPHSPFGGRYPYEIRWTGRLENAGIAVTNFGQNGLPAMRRAFHAVLAQSLQQAGTFELVSVMLGSNDILLGSSAKEAAADIGHLTEVLKEVLQGGHAASPGRDPSAARTASPRLLLIAPPAFTRGFWVDDDRLITASQKLGPALRAVAEAQGILFADASGWGISLAYDGVHFTEEGHRIFSEKLLEILKKY